MKTRRQKIICKIVSILACVLLCASFFCFPVSAATMYDVVFNIPAPGETLFFRVGGGTSINTQLFDSSSWNELTPPVSSSNIGPAADPDGVNYYFSYPQGSGNNGIVSFWLGRSKFGVERYQTSDVVIIGPGEFFLRTAQNDYINFTSYRFSLRSIQNDVVGSVVGYTSWNSMYLSGQSETNVNIQYSQLQFTIPQSVSADGLLLCLDIVSSAMNTTGHVIGIFDDPFSVVYTSGKDPNFPTYNPPDSGNTGQVEDLESGLLEDSSLGLDRAENQMDSVQLQNAFLQFTSSLTRIARVMTKLSGSIPYFEYVIYISLSLGLLAVLVSLSGSIVSAADRKGRGSKVSSKFRKKE